VKLPSGFLTSLLLVALGASVPSGAGIIELGVKGQKAKASTFQVIVEGQVFNEGSHVPGEDAASIADKVRANIDASPFYTAVIPDPNNNPTLITILKQPSGLEPNTIEVFIDDPNIGGTFVQFGSNGGFHARLRGADPNIAGNGVFEVDLTILGGIVYSYPISTVGKTSSQVNAALLAALAADGFIATGPANGPWDISKPMIRFEKVEMKRTDTGAQISGVELDSFDTAVPVTPSPVGIPTLGEWGILLLVGLLGITGVTLLARKGS